MRIICSLITILLFTAITAITAMAQPEIEINLPEFALRLVENGEIIKTYNIAIGTPYEQTPTGSFVIFYKQEYPTWYPGSNFDDRTPVPPGPENPLGTRWMEFYPNYGIHGTNKGWDINYPVSGGCIRMQDIDAKELYEKVPLGTPVSIRYQTLLLQEKTDGLYVKIFPDIYNRNTNTPEQLQISLAAYAESYALLNGILLEYKQEQTTIFEKKIGLQLPKPPTPSEEQMKSFRKTSATKNRKEYQNN